MRFYNLHKERDGLKEGERFRQLIQFYEPDIDLPSSTSSYQNELNTVFDWITENTVDKKPLPYVNDFLSKILVPGGIFTGHKNLDIWCVNKIIGLQDKGDPEIKNP